MPVVHMQYYCLCRKIHSKRRQNKNSSEHFISYLQHHMSLCNIFGADSPYKARDIYLLVYLDDTERQLGMFISAKYGSPEGPSNAVYHFNHFHSISILFFHSIFLFYFSILGLQLN